MLRFPGLIVFCFLVSACSQMDSVSQPENDTQQLVETSRKLYVPELSGEVVIFDNVAFGLGLPLRNYLSNEQAVSGKSVLDLGAGSGVLSLIALKYGASKVVATDINSNAVANAKYNATLFGFADRMDVRLVSMDDPGAYSVIGVDEKFDVIVSNPPQHPEEPKTIYEYSYADPKLAFLRSILEGLKDHLTPGGKGVLALYDQGLNLAKHMASDLGVEVRVLLQTSNRNGVYYLVEIQPVENK